MHVAYSQGTTFYSILGPDKDVYPVYSVPVHTALPVYALASESGLGTDASASGFYALPTDSDSPNPSTSLASAVDTPGQPGQPYYTLPVVGLAYYSQPPNTDLDVALPGPQPPPRASLPDQRQAAQC